MQVDLGDFLPRDLKRCRESLVEKGYPFEPATAMGLLVPALTSYRV